MVGLAAGIAMRSLPSGDQGQRRERALLGAAEHESEMFADADPYAANTDRRSERNDRDAESETHCHQNSFEEDPHCCEEDRDRSEPRLPGVRQDVHPRGSPRLSSTPCSWGRRRNGQVASRSREWGERAGGECR